MMRDGHTRGVEITLLWLIVILLIFGLFRTLNDWLSLPVVEVDAQTHRCLRVLGPDHVAYDCDHLPKQYATRFVYPEDWRMR